MGAEVVGRLTVRAEIDGLVAAAIAHGRGRGRGTVREEDLHVLGAAGAVSLSANPAGLKLVRAAAAAAIPLVALLLTECGEAGWAAGGAGADRGGGAGAVRGGEGAGGGVAELAPSENPRHRGR